MPIRANNAVAAPKSAAVAPADIGSPPPPCPFLSGAAAFTAGLGCVAPTEAADSLGVGGGHVTTPSLTTVVPRMTSSSMLTLNCPSFALHNSSESRNKFVEYRLLACVGRRVVGANDGAEPVGGADRRQARDTGADHEYLRRWHLAGRGDLAGEESAEFMSGLDDCAVAADVGHRREGVELLRA